MQLWNNIIIHLEPCVCVLFAAEQVVYSRFDTSSHINISTKAALMSLTLLNQLSTSEVLYNRAVIICVVTQARCRPHGQININMMF